MLFEQVFTSLPDCSCSQQWSISLNLLIPAAALSVPASGVRRTLLLSVLADASSGSQAGSRWPAVWLQVSAGAGAAVAVQWGSSAVREQPVSMQPNRDGVASVHLAVVRDALRLGVWLDSKGGWVLEDVWCVPPNQAVTYCTQPSDNTADSSFRALQLGASDDPGSSDISITSLRVYNYAIPRLSLGSESVCVDEGTCGRFLLAGWQPPAASSIPPGSISGSAVVAVSRTPIPLRSTNHYLLVSVCDVHRNGASPTASCLFVSSLGTCATPPTWTHCVDTIRHMQSFRPTYMHVYVCVWLQVGPWSSCSAVCGGGWSSREVRCMRLGAGTAAAAAEVHLEDCPLGE